MTPNKLGMNCCEALEALSVKWSSWNEASETRQQAESLKSIIEFTLHSSFRTKLCDFLPLVSFVFKVHMFYVFDFLKSKT